MNLLSPEETASYKSAMKDLFDTFCRDLPVRFYKSEKQIIVADPNYSSDWDQGINKNLKEAQYQEFRCRVWYLEREPYQNFILGNDKNIRYDGAYNRIKIHMELDAYEYLKSTQRFVFDGLEYRLDGAARGLGILGTIDYYEIILQRVQ